MLLLLCLLACGEKTAPDDSAAPSDDSASTDDSAAADDTSAADDSAADDSATPTDEDCRNGEDDDLDGLVDCEDADCVEDAACQEVCGNGEDDDLDGDLDCEDADCWTHLNCIERIEAVFTHAHRTRTLRVESQQRRELWYGSVYNGTPSSSWVVNVGATWTQSWQERSWRAAAQNLTSFEGALILHTPAGQQTCSFDRVERSQRGSGWSASSSGWVTAASGLTWTGSASDWIYSNTTVAVPPGAGAAPCDGALRAELADEIYWWFPTFSPLTSSATLTSGGTSYSAARAQGRLRFEGWIQTSYADRYSFMSSAMPGSETLTWRP